MSTSSAVKLKTAAEMDAMAEAGRAVATALERMKRSIVPGQTSTLDLEMVARETLSEFGAVPALMGYQPAFSKIAYQHASCISVNEEVIHGVPQSGRILREGDVVGLDLVGCIDGWHADSTITVIVGSGSKKAQQLVSVTREALLHGIRAAKPGATLGDVGHAIQRLVEKNGFSVMRDLCGHGIGQVPHEEGLDVWNFGSPGRGVRLVPGMTFCIEPMVAVGRPEVTHRPDDPWAVLSRDGSLTAHFEHTVGITEDGVRVLTAMP